MPLLKFKCVKCNEVFRTFAKDAYHCKVLAKRVITPPRSKFMEAKDDSMRDRGKSQLKNQEAILRERTRNFKRDHETDDLIQSNPQTKAVEYGWFNRDGKKRNKIDDI